MQYFISDDRNIEFVVTEKITKDFTLHNHTHHYVVSYILKGSCKLFYNNVTMDLSKGDVFIVRPYMPHSVMVDQESKILSLCIHKSLLNDKVLDELNSIISLKFNELSNEIILDKTVEEKLLDGVSLIKQTINDERYKLPKEIESIAEKIAEKSSEPFSLNQLSSEVYVSKYHLIRKFKSKIGLTPHQFMIQVRVRKAQKSIAEGERLVDAAIDNGFYDSSHFDKCFEKIVGIAPSDFSKKSNILQANPHSEP